MYNNYFNFINAQRPGDSIGMEADQVAEPKIYEFHTNLNEIIHLKIEQFALSETEALQWLENLNRIFATRCQKELINGFACPQYNHVTHVYCTEEFIVPFELYQKTLRENTSDIFALTIHTHTDLTDFGMRCDENQMRIRFQNNRTNREICSTVFEKKVVSPHKFEHYLAARIKENLGDNYTEMDAVIMNYTSAVTNFIAAKWRENDVVKLALDSNDLFENLRTIFNGRKEWVPELQRANSPIFDLLRDRHNSSLAAALVIKGRTGNTSNGITGIMLAAARICEIGENTDDSLNRNLQTIDRLLAEGVDINARDIWDRTALFYVAFPSLMFGRSVLPGRCLMTQKLLDAGANPNLTDVYGKTALDYYPLDNGTPHDGITLLCLRLLVRVLALSPA